MAIHENPGLPVSKPGVSQILRVDERLLGNFLFGALPFVPVIHYSGEVPLEFVFLYASD